MAVERVSGSTVIDTSQLKAFVRATRQASKVAAAGTRRSLVEIGEIVAVEARHIADEHSTSIGPTIRPQVRGASVSVVAGGPASGAAGRQLARELFEAPYGSRSSGNRRRSLQRQADGALAVLYEKGNKGKSEDSPTFSHPVFGNRDAWVAQPRYPFLVPAAERMMPAVEAAVGKVADGVADTLGGWGV
jgi:hypothetical protein